ncbi:hypothetical protein GCFR_02724 [Citrobacter freundii ATCC 8090 = MTCC 1658 = NBRC 12681]|uniref:P-loop NTPase fold protein n=3 Tax=Citrobacter freundii TaxID=546 RepID=UPI00044DE8EB|nr:P-loop NTPase fold protein [Citrobacter freundii]EXF31642.1 hypothetical protein V172_06340 [Citrobacter freundii RLS1]KFB96305.1 hypothetical protein GCFR_02724 [Citrobacter freundii ATCC 8090 = MTCC 1658 = NBRC 12681]QIH70725.1 hypothetical protein G4551_20415 [Citrobacter freundii ATCC 8090 = MTCC 1658 = NBRC 12681]WOY54492.1 hypothetical protein R6I13_20515 [Citrobacter freundii]WPZ47758.1 hypothetical protein R6I57_20520 [Citrobacter freundii]
MIDKSLQEYLNYYIQQNEPSYAVLITGDWGIGKTYQIMNVLPKEQVCYISLFGLSSTSEIYANVFAAMYPRRNAIKNSASAVKDSTTELNGITFGAGAIISSLADAFIKEKVDNKKIIVFDDLERCSINLKDILGAINKYVEHHKCRVLVIAHDSEIESEFIATKEKIIGHTIKIKPQIDHASNAFFCETDKLKHYDHIKNFIISAFKSSHCQSLRILRHVIKDCERLISCMLYSQINNHDAMQEVFNTFTILNIEFRLSNILANEIKELDAEFTSFSYILPNVEGDDEEEDDDEKIKEKRLKKLFNNYSQEIFSGGIFNDELIYLMLVDGIYPQKTIRKKIQQSKYFKEKTKTELPAWLKIQSFDYTDDDIVDSSITEMLRQFKHREINEIGTLLHMFHLMFLMSSINVIDECFEEIFDECKAYLDDLVAENRLPYDNSSDNFYNINLNPSAHGHGFWLNEEYKSFIYEIKSYLQSKQKEALHNNYPEFAKEIMQALDNDIDEFKRLLIGDGSTPGKYASIDVLSTIPYEDFVLSWLCRPYIEWDRIRNILINRYTRGIAINILANEKEWLCAVAVTIKIEAMKMNGFERLRIERIVPTRALQQL